MANVMESLLNGMIGFNNGKVVLDEEKAAQSSERLGSIASSIDSSTAQLKGVMTELQTVWTGNASDKFSEELSELVNHIQEVSQNLRDNKANLDTVISVIMAAEGKVASDVDSLNENSIFTFK